MNYYFCFISAEDIKKHPNAEGMTYAYEHKSDWVLGAEGASEWVSGSVLGVHYVIHYGKAYWLKKIYYDIDESNVVVVCTESTQGCDN